MPSEGSLSPEIKHLIIRMLDPNPATRINISEIKQHDWFKLPTATLEEVKTHIFKW
jgi:serine/threonine protein kinase